MSSSNLASKRRLSFRVHRQMRSAPGSPDDLSHILDLSSPDFQEKALPLSLSFGLPSPPASTSTSSGEDSGAYSDCVNKTASPQLATILQERRLSSSVCASLGQSPVPTAEEREDEYGDRAPTSFHPPPQFSNQSESTNSMALRQVLDLTQHNHKLSKTGDSWCRYSPLSNTDLVSAAQSGSFPSLQASRGTLEPLFVGDSSPSRDSQSNIPLSSGPPDGSLRTRFETMPTSGDGAVRPNTAQGTRSRTPTISSRKTPWLRLPAALSDDPIYRTPHGTTFFIPNLNLRRGQPYFPTPDTWDVSGFLPTTRRRRFISVLAKGHAPDRSSGRTASQLRRSDSRSLALYALPWNPTWSTSPQNDVAWSPFGEIILPRSQPKRARAEQPITIASRRVDYN
ncbi:hypothetical protein K488DRAFT_86355 [Vararia minispora EC-137]|uniref:Uncharacterized protein n=1 Tax=Vararia minispora EC-137 TaxID=1314806 RepID=A0ACB8QKQ1_9AGAM|nr:hypothetical protein K488DRAFT_86355 [Vararia minispora EC-137]